MKLINFSTIKVITGSGMLFLVLQVVGALTYTSDSLIIAQMLGPTAVADYTIPEKLFSLISVALTMMLAPLWPAYSEAFARGDKDWIRKTLKRSLLFSVSIAAISTTVLVLFGPVIISLWLGHEIYPPFLLLLGLAVWKILEAAGNALAVFLNGARIIRFQVIAGIITAIASVLLKLFLIRQIGISGVVWATTTSYVICIIIPIIYLKIITKVLK